MTETQRMELKELRESADGPIHNGDFWNQEELERAKFLFNTNFGISEIALALGRGEVATCMKLFQLGLYGSKNRQKRRATLAAACARTAPPVPTIVPSVRARTRQRRMNDV